MNKEIMFEKGLERYLYNLDIFTYFSKMREIEILKHILVSPNQKDLVNFLSKPSISLIINDQESPLNLSNNSFRNTEDGINSFYDSFKKCHNKYLENKDQTYQKLLQLTSYELFQLIQDEKSDYKGK